MMYIFMSMLIVPVYFNRDFMNKNPLPASGFEPMTFQLEPSCLGITFLSGICFTTINCIAPIGSQWSRDKTEVHKTFTVVTFNFTKSLYIQ